MFVRQILKLCLKYFNSPSAFKINPYDDSKSLFEFLHLTAELLQFKWKRKKLAKIVLDFTVFSHFHNWALFHARIEIFRSNSRIELIDDIKISLNNSMDICITCHTELRISIPRFFLFLFLFSRPHKCVRSWEQLLLRTKIISLSEYARGKISEQSLTFAFVKLLSFSRIWHFPRKSRLRWRSRRFNFSFIHFACHQISFSPNKFHSLSVAHAKLSF